MSNFQFHDLLTKLSGITETEQKDGDYVKGTDEITSKQTPGKPPQAHALKDKLVGESEEADDDKDNEDNETTSEDKDTETSDDEGAKNDPWGIGDSGVYGDSSDNANESDNTESPVSDTNDAKDDDSEDDDAEDDDNEEDTDSEDDNEDDNNAEEDTDSEGADIDLDEDMIAKLTDEFADFLVQKVEGGELNLHGDEEFDPEMEEGMGEEDGAAALERVTQRAQERGGPCDRIGERVAARLEPGEEALEEEPEEDPYGDDVDECGGMMESAPKQGETIKLNGKEVTVVAVNESRMVVKMPNGKTKIIEMTKIKEGYYGRGMSAKDRFKRDELEHELGHETNNYQIKINGRPWKVFASEKHADAIANKMRAKGKKVDVFMTSLPISENRFGMSYGGGRGMSAKDRFKRDELEHELGHETNNYQIKINGRPWKVFASERHADAIANKMRAKGKKVDVFMTSLPVSESISEGKKKISENYNTRLNQIMKMIQTGRSDYSQADLRMAAQDAAKKIGAMEISGKQGANSKYWKEMMSDIRQQARSAGIMKSPKAKSDKWSMPKRKENRPSVNANQIAHVASKMEEIVGSSYPDADPFDQLLPFLEKRFPGIEPMDMLDKAAKSIGANDYHDYLATFWDEAGAEENPWR